MKNKLVIIVGLLLLSLLSCEKKQRGSLVFLEEPDIVKLEDLFSKIELIPLETNDNTLISSISKLVYKDQTFFLSDKRSHQIQFYDEDGKFKGKIDKRGMGPGEYLNVSDFNIDFFDQYVWLLSAVNRSLYIYNFQGDFVEEVKLPAITSGYKRFCKLNADTIAFWTYDYVNRVKYYSIREDAIVFEAFPEDDKDRFCTFEFYSGFLYRSLTNVIYSLEKDGLVPIFEWNFGKLNNDLQDFPVSDNSINFDQKIGNDILNSRIVNYVLALQLHNKDWFYAKIIRKGKFYQLFQRKDLSRTLFFEEFVEGITMHPIWMDDICMVGLHGDNINEVLNSSILSEKDREILQNYNVEENNPLLIKYYFKNENK